MNGMLLSNVFNCVDATHKAFKLGRRERWRRHKEEERELADLVLSDDPGIF